MSRWLNLKSYQKPKLALSLNDMTSIKSLKKINNIFPKNHNSSENQYLIGGVSSSDGVDADVALGACRRIPKGFVAVYVGPELTRFVIPACCLSVPEIRALMDNAAEEFGYHHQGGGIRIPNCDPHDFLCILATSPHPREKSAHIKHS